ncbi:hypothetical protein Tsubulata_030619 [Turnera subulata]|uniref:PORR domain-containing protein n=1 Tax=Turnera subulata TaxID=218843 RepID=A0A9Q0GJF0_9ROSI|nr:hypothetical protein Tsubulata_030619 [Turnera subulata]
MSLCTAKLHHQFRQTRTFIAARVKWVRDAYLDKAVSKEKDLKQTISLKNKILSSPSKSLPLSSLSLLKPQLKLPTTTQEFLQKYSYVFSEFQPSPSLPLHAKLTPLSLSVHKEEQAVYNSRDYRDDAIKRLAKLLMLTRAKRLPLHVIDTFKFDLGLPHDYFTALLSDYPEYFHICEDGDSLGSTETTFFLELVSWKVELAVSELEKRAANGDIMNVKRGQRIPFTLSYPSGFDLK